MKTKVTPAKVQVGSQQMTPAQLSVIITQLESLLAHLKLARFRYEAQTGTGVYALPADSECAEAMLH